MRVDAKFLHSPSGATGTRSASGQRFSLGQAAGSAKGPGVASSAALSTLDALLAVQGEENPRERRRRSVKRGYDLLGALDGLKAALLGGQVSGADLKRLASELSERRENSGDAALDDILGHIELRARVEMAKLGQP